MVTTFVINRFDSFELFLYFGSDHMSEGRYRNWCFTINNFTEEDEKDVIFMIETLARAGIAEHEVGDQGTLHIQGYVQFPNPIRFNTIKELIKRAHIEPAKGSWKENFLYCSKDNTVIVIKGHQLSEISLEERERKRLKTNWDEVLDDAKVLSKEEFSVKYPKIWILYRDKIEKVMIDVAMRHVITWSGNLQQKNFWLYGDPGVGKSRWAANQVPYFQMYKKNFNKWWDGFSVLDTKLVVIENYPGGDAGNTLVYHMKIWADRFPFIGECKGSHMLLNPGKFILIITSNFSIDQCFKNPIDVEAIKRRFTEVNVKIGDLFSQCMNHVDLSILD